MAKTTNQTSIFLIDLNIFEIKDFLADDNGVYVEYGNKTRHYNFTDVNNIKSSRNKTLSIDLNSYIIKKKNYKLKSNKSFLRKTCKITNAFDINLFNKIVLVYFFDDKLKIQIDLKINVVNVSEAHLTNKK